jgi:hypothetical protein
MSDVHLLVLYMRNLGALFSEAQSGEIPDLVKVLEVFVNV